MRNLLNFLIRYSTWFLFVLYILLSCVLMVSNNSYRQSVYLTSANIVTGSMYKASSNVIGYFNLREINASLQASNARLENEVLNLKHQLAQYKTIADDTLLRLGDVKRFDYTPATVINNSTRHPKNHFTIDRGALDGLVSGMGVVDQNGIVGIVNVAGPHMSRVISVLNETQHFSVKIKDTSFVGSLAWRGGDPAVAYFGEVPRHAKYHIGDTIVTSGFSTTFPEGIPVGTIMNMVKGSDDSFFTFKVKLASNFRALSTVRVIKDFYKEELDSLQTTDNVVNPATKAGF